MIHFINPGLLDLRLVRTFGASIKPNSSTPIGFFGTGLKHAIATTLRLGGSVELFLGAEGHTFHTRETIIRDQAVQMVCLDGSDLSFTLDLGRTWEPWQAYREFMSNTIDENGGAGSGPGEPRPDWTLIRISGPVAQIHAERHKYFLQSTPIWSELCVEVHPGPAIGFFYRGVLASVFDVNSPSLFTYNFIGDYELSEDRTFKAVWGVHVALSQALVQCPNEDILDKILNAPKQTFEHKLDFDWHGLEPSPQFLAIAMRAIKTKAASANATAMALLRRLDPELARPEPFIPDLVERSQLKRAVEFCKKLGFVAQGQICLAERLGDGILGSCIGKDIYIARAAFAVGTKCVAGTLLEEIIHQKEGLKDCERAMQNYLVDLVCTVGERLMRKPL